MRRRHLLLAGETRVPWPVEQPITLDLVINTATALRLMTPQSLLQRADEVIA